MSVDQRNNENPASYVNSRVTSFRANALWLLSKALAYSLLSVHGKKARRMKEIREMKKENFKVSGNNGKIFSLSENHCPPQPTGDKQMVRDNNIAPLQGIRPLVHYNEPAILSHHDTLKKPAANRLLASPIANLCVPKPSAMH